MFSAALEYWVSGEGLEHITPPGDEWPEGEAFFDAISQLCAGKTVLDFGCGIGRLAPLFAPQLYRGVDVCAPAVAAARGRNPEYRFEVVNGQLPQADVTLAHTVLLHVPDDEIENLVGSFASPVVIISEILGRHWRRSDGVPPVFNREKRDYMGLMRGYRFRKSIPQRYVRYPETDITTMIFDRR